MDVQSGTNGISVQLYHRIGRSGDDANPLYDFGDLHRNQFQQSSEERSVCRCRIRGAVGYHGLAYQ